jgi:hypothetical protein
VDAGAGHLAAGPEAGEGGGPVEVGHRPATQVVRGRGHGQPVGGRVEAGLPHRRGDGGEALVEALQRGGVEPEVLGALLEHPLRHGPAHPVPRQQLVHEAFAPGVPQQRAVAPQRLREEGPGHGRVVQGGGVELHELDVGHRHAGPHRHGHAVARGLGGVGGDGVERARPARGQQHRAGPHLGPIPRRRERHHAPAAPALHQQLEGEPSFEHRRRRALDGRHQRPLHLGPRGGAAGVHHPGFGVAALPGQEQRPFGIEVELGPQGDEIDDPPRALVHQHPHGVDVAQAGPRGERVGQVQVGGVGLDVRVQRRYRATEDRGHAALGPPGGRLGQLRLGEDPHPHPGLGRRPHRGGQARHPAPEDQEFEVRGPGHDRQGPPAGSSTQRRPPGTSAGSTARLAVSTWTTVGS